MCRLFLLWQTVATRIVKGNNYMSFILWNIFALLISDVSTIINLCCTWWRRCLYLTSKSKRCNLLLLILFYSIESLLLQLLLLSICLSFSRSYDDIDLHASCFNISWKMWMLAPPIHSHIKEYCLFYVESNGYAQIISKYFWSSSWNDFGADALIGISPLFFYSYFTMISISIS